MMRITVWTQFSSNHSSAFTVVGVFQTPEAAQRAATEVQQMIETMQAWWRDHPESWGEYGWPDAPTPPEVEFGQRFGFAWPGAVEWYANASVEVVLERLVYISPRNFRPDTAGEPFDKVMTGLGGTGLIDGNLYGDQIGTILADITCDALDEMTAQEIVREQLGWNKLSRADGRHLRFYDWAFTEFHLPTFVEYLRSRGCTGITYRLHQSEDPLGKPPTTEDVEVLVQILELSRDIDHVAHALADIQDKRAVEPLLRALGSVDSFDRRAVIFALGVLGDTHATDALIRLLDEADCALSSAWALGQIGDARAAQPLIECLKHWEHWQRVAEALAHIGEPVRARLLQAMGPALSEFRDRLQYTLALLDERTRSDGIPNAD